MLRGLCSAARRAASSGAVTPQSLLALEQQSAEASRTLPAQIEAAWERLGRPHTTFAASRNFHAGVRSVRRLCCEL